MFAIDFSSAPFVRVQPSTEPAPADSANERMYQLSETFFGTVGPRLVSLGWSVFPQERDGKRRSGIVDGIALKWKPYQNRLPTTEEINAWAAQCPTHNVAVICGPASGHVIAIDVDVNDEKLAWRVRDLAEEFLGHTPLQRIGRKPRIVLLYRTDGLTRIGKRAYRFVSYGDNNAVVLGEDMIEILASGSPFTAYGRHHKTGRYFSWPENQPLNLGPDAAPLVTQEQLTAFLAAVQEVRPFFKPTTSASVDSNWEYDADSNLVVPKLSGGGASWVEDGGIVVDGREQFLFELVKRAIRANSAAALGGEAGERNLVGLVIEEFKTKAAMTGKWDGAYLRAEAQEKVHRGIENFKESGAHGFTPHRAADGTFLPDVGPVQPPTREVIAGIDSLSFIPPTGASGRNSVKIVVTRQREDAAAEERRLIPDRSGIAIKVKEDIHKALDEFFGEVYALLSDGVKRIHVLKAPTGGGKTSHSIRYIAADPRTKQYDADMAKGRDTPGPILFLLPTYNNIDELRLRANVLNLDNSLDDAGLAEQALELGLIREDEIETRIADLRRDAIDAGLKTMVYRGKLAAGCEMQDKMKLLMEAGVGTSGLCRAEGKDAEGQRETIECVHYQTCPAIRQRKEIGQSHVVFLAHAFLTLTIPEELKTARAVVADERVFHLFVHTASMPKITLTLPRKKPKLTKTERRAIDDKVEGALDAEGLLIDRETASRQASNALSRRQCPALALFEYSHTYANGKTVSGQELVAHAKRVCGNALTSGTEITPKTPFEDLVEMCNKPSGTDVREEWRFWQIIEERIEAMVNDRAHAELIASARANHALAVERAAAAGEAPPEDRTALYERAWKRQALGDREMRVQFLIENVDGEAPRETIRLSWRSKPNWADSPLLLLDASASPEIIGKIFNEREVVVHNVEAPLNVRTVAVLDRTYSNSSIVAGVGRKPTERLQSGRLLQSLRNAIATVSSLYGWGRVVCGASVIVRRAINTNWKQPTNVDWCHFGAMRGLDFAKNHTAALSVGRMEVPIKIIDGLVAALTYDDETPEDPYDRNGDNTGPDNEPLKLPFEAQTVMMRSGHDVSVAVPRFPGYWASKVQEQYREEELSQFLGRLRPVYREGEAPIWFAISKVIPSHVIVDDIVALNDIVAKPNLSRYIQITLWDAVRKADGLAHPELLAAVNPTLYKDPADAGLEMCRHNLDPSTGKCDPSLRSTWGFTPAAVRGPDGAVSWCFVRTDIRDPACVVRDAFRTHLGWELAEADVVMGQPARPFVASGRREVDWVDEHIGAPDERSDGEEHALTAAATWLVDNLPASAFTTVTGQPQRLPLDVKTPADDPAVGGLSLRLSEVAAAQSTDVMWSKITAGHSDRLTAKIAEPGAEFDHLGDGAFDDDGDC